MSIARGTRIALLGFAVAVAALTAAVIPARADSTTLFSGVLQTSGTAAHRAAGVDTGAQIDLYVWPDEVGTMAEGDTQDMIPVSTTTAGPGGAYTLTAPINASTTAAAQANGGFVNFLEVVNTTGGQMLQTNFSAELQGTSWAVGNAASEDLTQPDTTLANAPSQPVTPNNGCHIPPKTTLLNAHSSWSTVGEVHTANDQTDQFGYGHDGHASTNIGVGFSYSDASFTADGTNYRSDSASVQWPTTYSQTGRAARSLFMYHHNRVYYPCQAKTDYIMHSTQWLAGDQWYGNNHNLDGHCQNNPNHTTFLPGSGFTKIQGRGATWSGGVTMTFPTAGLSFTASTEQGWGTNVQSHWHFGQTYSTYYLCGDTAGIVTSQRVFAGG